MNFRSIKLYKQERIDLDKLLASLSGFGYQRHSKIAQEAEYAVRGGIIDIFPSTFEYPIRIELDNNKISSIKSFDKVSGRLIFEHTIAIILPKKISKNLKFRHFSEEEPIENFIDLAPGDYVVHNQYGVGKFTGIKRLESSGKMSDHMIIQYADGDKLYVPQNFMHLVQKYIGFARRPPRIYKLGGKEWQKIKDRKSVV